MAVTNERWSVLRTALVLLGIIGILALSPCALQAQNEGSDVPTADEPAVYTAPTEELTAEMVSQYCTLIEWILEVRLTVAQKAKINQRISVYFKARDQKRIKAFHGYIDNYRDLAAMAPAKRREACRSNMPHVLEEVDRLVRQGDAEAKWLRQTFFTAHPLLVATDPPLTRQIAASWLELDQFIRAKRVIQAQEVEKRTARKPTFTPAPPMSRRREILKVRWSAMKPEERYRYYRLPGEVAVLKAKWKTMTDREKNQLLDRLVYERVFLLNESPEQF